MNQPSSLKLGVAPPQQSGQQKTPSSLSLDSDAATLASPGLSPTLTSPPGSVGKTSKNVSDTTTRLNLQPSVTISFVKGDRLFKLQYSYIDVCKDASGSLKRLELGSSSGQQSVFIHTFPSTRLPIPHLEEPIVSSRRSSFRVSFLEEQTVQTAQLIFLAQPYYTFEKSDDCVRFQEALLGQRVLFVGGMAEAKSKGRGEECISQNLRVLGAPNGALTIIFFANSQRKTKKRYISIPVNCVQSVDQSSKAGRPLSLTLQPNFELLSQLKVLQIKFLDDAYQQQFHQILCQVVGG